MQHLCGCDRHAFAGHDAAVAAYDIEDGSLHSGDAHVVAELLPPVESVRHPTSIPFVGHGLLAVKGSGSIALPEFIRRSLGACRSRIFLGLHETDPCLVIFAQGSLGRLDADRRQSTGFDGTPAISLSCTRRVFGFCEELWRPFHDIRLSEWARAIAGISTSALFVGTGATFELWSPEEATASGDVNLVALAKSAAKFLPAKSVRRIMR